MVRSITDEFTDLGKVAGTLKAITALRDTISVEAQQALCTHENVIKDSESGKCADCGIDTGWYCPKSPDHTCHYYSEKKPDGYYVRLITGKAHKIVKYSKDKHENEEEDWCIFCGQPDERK